MKKKKKTQPEIITWNCFFKLEKSLCKFSKTFWCRDDSAEPDSAVSTIPRSIFTCKYLLETSCENNLSFEQNEIESWKYSVQTIHLLGWEWWVIKNIWNGWEKNRLRPCCLELPAVHGHKVSLDVSRGPGSNLESLWSKQVFSLQESFDPTKSLKMSGKVWLLSIHWCLENITVIQLKFNFFASYFKWDKRVSSQIKYGNFKNIYVYWLIFYMNTNNFTSSTNEHYSWPV